MPIDVEGMKKSGKRDERGVRVQKFTTRSGNKPIEVNELDNNTFNAITDEFLSNIAEPPPNYETVEQLVEAISDYANWIKTQNNLNNAHLIPDVEGMCSFIRVPRATVLSWERRDTRGFGYTISLARDWIATCKKQMALKGEIPPLIFATDMNNNHDYVNPKNQVEITARPMEVVDRDALIREALAMPIENPQIEDKVKLIEEKK